jgi:hypothetical protein
MVFKICFRIQQLVPLRNGTVFDAGRVPYDQWGGLAPFPTEEIYTYAPKGANLDVEC